MLNLPYISMPCYQYNFPTILHCSWVIKQGELNTFSAFSHLRARLKGSYTACLSQAAIKRSLRPGNERRGGGGEVGWSIIARSERNLCVWSRALRMSACQPGNFSSCVWKHVLFSKNCWGNVWVFGPHFRGENWHLWLCISNESIFLYLLKFVNKR